MQTTAFFLALSLLPAGPLLAQKPSFEAASIRHNNSGAEGGGAGPRGDRFNANNAPLSMLVQYAFAPAQGQFLRSQVFGLPAWADSDRYDLEAKVAGDARATPVAQMRAMVESLLEDRFQMKAHREKRDLPVYNLVLVKGGPKLSADQTPPPSRNLMIDFVTEGQPAQELPRGGMRMIRSPASTALIGTAVTLPRLVQMLQGQSDRIIMDHTEFTGLFDIHLQFSAAAQQIAGGDSTAPSLFTAIQEIGLKLESAKAPLDVVVVDHIEKPTEN